MRSSPPPAEPRDWRLALVAVNAALPFALTPAVRALPPDLRDGAYLAALAALVILNARIAARVEARPWAVLCAMLTLVSGLVFGSLSWIATLGWLPALLALTPPP